MGKDITRFISHEFRIVEFEKMLQAISTKTRVSPELVRQYSTTAMKEWENGSGRDVLRLFTVSPNTRRTEISRILDHLRDHLRPIIFSRKRLDLAMKIASESLENMYHLY